MTVERFDVDEILNFGKNEMISTLDMLLSVTQINAGSSEVITLVHICEFRSN